MIAVRTTRVGAGIAASVLACALAGPALASDVDDFRSEELRLTATYGVVQDMLAQGPDAGAALDALRQAQRAWIAFRDSDCARRLDDAARLDCMVAMTAARANALEAEAGLSAPVGPSVSERKALADEAVASLEAVCTPGGTGVEMRACVALEAARNEAAVADARLRVADQLAQLETGALSAFEDADAAWGDYMTATCEAVAADSPDDAIGPARARLCRSLISQQRVFELRENFLCWSEGDCPGEERDPDDTDF